MKYYPEGISRKTQITWIAALFLLFIIFCVHTSNQETEKSDEEKKFLIDQNLILSGVVKKTMPRKDEDKGRLVIYLQNFKSNKGDEYECIYKGRYLYCKISGGEAIIIGDNEMEPNDSVVFNTAKLTYQIYRNGKLDIENGTAVYDDDWFYEHLDLKGYLTFDYYHDK